MESEKRRDGAVIEREVRLYNSSLAHDALTPEQWLYLIRAHWGVENNNHHTLPNSVSLRGGRPVVLGRLSVGTPGPYIRGRGHGGGAPSRSAAREGITFEAYGHRPIPT